MTKAMHAGRRASRFAPLMVCVFAAACLPEVPKPKAASASSSSAGDDVTTTATEETQAVPYVYSPVGKRDPFSDPTSKKAQKEVGPNAGPLQKYDLDQLRLAFTTTATSSPLALLIDPTNQAHMVQIGDFVGKNWGKVSSIKRDEITIMETIADPNTGRVYPDYLPLKMPKSDTEQQAEQNFTLRVATEGASSP